MLDWMLEGRDVPRPGGRRHSGTFCLDDRQCEVREQHPAVVLVFINLLLIFFFECFL